MKSRTTSKRSGSVALALGLMLSGLQSVQAADFSAWPMKMKITFSGYDRMETLTNFPALVVFTNNLAGHFRYLEMASPSNAGDLRFSASDSTTELSYEIDTWNPDGTSCVWVRVPELASSTDYIYAYWGNGAAATPPPYTTNGTAWASSYKAVWHLGGAGSTRRDSTTNGFTGTLDATGVAATGAGVIGGADSFTGTAKAYPASGGINCGNVSVTNSQTIEMWVKVSNRTQRRNPLNKAYGGEGTLVIETDGRIAFYHGTAGKDASPYQANETPANTVNIDQWVHLAHVRDLSGSPTLRWYVNGQAVKTITSSYTATKASTSNLLLGKGYVDCFNGLLDEVRVSSAAYSSNRIWACWMNAGDPYAFQTVTPATTALPLVTVAPASNITTTAAWLNGSLMSTGSSATAVTLYWGMSSGGTNTSNWTYSHDWAAPQAPGELSFDVSNLTADGTCYYRMMASNESGTVWSRVENFISGELTLAATSNADEKTLTPGAFTVSRPATATNEALTVFYAITGGSAQPNVDFVPLSGTVTLPAGAATAEIAVVPLKNYAVSSDTTLQLTLTGAAAIIGAASNASLTIVNQVLLDNVFVSKTGDHSDGDTWATALHDLQDGLNLVAANGTVHVAGGQTFELAAAALWPAFNGITLRGGYEAVTGSEPGANDPQKWPTVIKTQVGVNVRLLTLSSVSGATLENLTFRDGRERVVNRGGAVYANAVSGLTVRNCRFLRNSVVIGTPGGGALAADGSSGMITNSVFLGNYAAETTGHGTGARGGAFYLSGGNWTLRDLQVHGNWTAAGSGAYRNSRFDAAGGIYLGGSGGSFSGKNLLVVNNDGGGIMVGGGAATLENLTVSGNSFAGVSVASAAAAGTTIRNSILFGNRDDFVGTVPKLHYNIIGDSTGTGTHGNLATDPAFVFPLFYLSAGSGALNSGTGTVAEAGLNGTTVLTQGLADSGTVSRGYHFPTGVIWDLDVHVAAGGTGDGSSASSPLGSITAALAQNAPRTRIHIAAGTYTKTTEAFPLIVHGRTVQFLGTNATTTIIDVTGAGQRFLSVLDAPFGDNRIEGLTLQGAYATSQGGGGCVRIDGATLSVLNSIFRNNTCYSAECFGGGLFAQDATVFISDCDFFNNLSQNTAGHVTGLGSGVGAWSAVTMKIHQGVYSGNTSYWMGNYGFAGTPLYCGGAIWLGSGLFELRNLLLENNTGGGINVAASSTQNGAAGPGLATLDNLTVATNNAVGIQVHAESAPSCTIRNTIAYGNNVTNFWATAIPTVFANNCIGNNPRAGVDGNISDDPLFADAVNGDFQLANGSPCFNAGLKLDWMTTAIDLAGNPRVRARLVDIGAYEIEPPGGTLLLVR